MMRSISPLALIITAGFVLRVFWHFFGPATDPTDAAVYIASGEALFATGKMSSELYMPLYPILLHLVGIETIIWLQIVLSTLTIPLAKALADRLWRSEYAGLIAAAFCAVHPVLIYYANLRLTETSFAFLFLLGILFLFRQQFFAATLALVLANLIKPSFDIVLPLIVLAGVLIVPRTGALVFALRRLGVFVAVYVTLMSPWWMHNYYVYGKFVRLTLSDGITLLLENNPSFERHGLDWTKDPPWARYGGISDPVARNDAMKADAVAYIRERPLTWLTASVDRLKVFLTPWPSEKVAVQFKVACSVAILPFMLGALAALWHVRRLWRLMLPLMIPVAFITLVHVATHATMRYRLPIDPLLIVLAAGPIAATLRAIALSFRSRQQDASS
jgi:hypothetical protein